LFIGDILKKAATAYTDHKRDDDDTDIGRLRRPRGGRIIHAPEYSACTGPDDHIA